LDKRETLETDNLMFLRMDAEDINDFFAPDEIDRIYLNFSDPWPKDRHAKRRLTSRQFLERYDKILIKDGYVQFKTDNRPLFDFSLEEVKESGWILDEYTFDLHQNGPAPNNVMTEYEEKFYNLGNPICKLIAHREFKED
ncbi:MAG: tRNA (guanosine(46)-N7)-methyltransferase TrmB, partial [Lachnospiraceae bacterium]|nr:tRNA (guanosine(46)-N7)-methyltransferase TrmB [Lachnospiraceae bacterium]